MMGWHHNEKEISKEDYEAIMAQEKRVSDFFTYAQIIGYGAIPGQPYEKDGKYYIPYGISDTCD